MIRQPCHVADLDAVHLHESLHRHVAAKDPQSLRALVASDIAGVH